MGSCRSLLVCGGYSLVVLFVCGLNSLSILGIYSVHDIASFGNLAVCAVFLLCILGVRFKESIATCCSTRIKEEVSVDVQDGKVMIKAISADIVYEDLPSPGSRTSFVVLSDFRPWLKLVYTLDMVFFCTAYTTMTLFLAFEIVSNEILSPVRDPGDYSRMFTYGYSLLRNVLILLFTHVMACLFMYQVGNGYTQVSERWVFGAKRPREVRSCSDWNALLSPLTSLGRAFELAWHAGSTDFFVMKKTMRPWGSTASGSGPIVDLEASGGVVEANEVNEDKVGDEIVEGQGEGTEGPTSAPDNSRVVPDDGIRADKLAIPSTWKTTLGVLYSNHDRYSVLARLGFTAIMVPYATDVRWGDLDFVAVGMAMSMGLYLVAMFVKDKYRVGFYHDDRPVKYSDTKENATEAEMRHLLDTLELSGYTSDDNAVDLVLLGGKKSH